MSEERQRAGKLRDFLKEPGFYLGLKRNGRIGQGGRNVVGTDTKGITWAEGGGRASWNVKEVYGEGFKGL